MTESAFRNESSPETEAFADEAETDSRRNLVLFGALGAVVLAAGAFFFLGSGEDASEELAFPTSKRTPRVEAPAAPAEQAVTLPPPAEVPLGRNPFKALYVQPVAAPVVAKPPPPPPHRSRPRLPPRSSWSPTVVRRPPWPQQRLCRAPSDSFP